MKKLIILAPTLLLVGCVSFVAPLNTAYTPETHASYVYADIYVSDHSLSLAGKLSVALSLVNTDNGEPTYLRFKESDTAYPVKISPGNYKLKGVVFLNHYNQIKFEKPFSGDTTFEFKANEGKMYYLGDYKGRATWTSGSIQHSEWAVNDFKDNYAETTAKIRISYPGLSKLDAIDVFRKF